MAKLFPNKLSGSVPAVVARTFRQLKKLPDSFSVWYNLSQSKTHPHFLIVWEDRCAYLLHIADTSQQLVETAIHGNLFETSEPITIESLGDQEKAVLARFTQNLPTPESFPIKPIVLFPNVNKGTLDTISAELAKDSGIHFIGKQQFSPDKLADYLVQHAPEHLNGPQLIQLRHHFSPEVHVPTRFSPLAVNRPQLEAALTPQLLDLDQEWCMKNNLYLPEELHTLVDSTATQPTELNSTSQLVTGVAGSGKSLILLYRALLNAKLNPKARVLVLTHNRPINNELQARFDHLSDKKYQVSWLTFFAWARQQLSNDDWPKEEKLIYPEDALKIIGDLARNNSNNYSASFLLDEIGFIKDQNIRKLPDYLTISRTGQGKGLKEPQRRAIWLIFKAYQDHLKKNNSTDWHNIAIRFHDKAMRGECTFPAYHCILIDEAQFFAKSWFDVVKKALIPGGQLFLAADPTQGFLKRRQSWISSGIEVRGRTTKLAKAYRNSKEILRFATDFYHQRQRSAEHLKEDEGLNLLSDLQINQAKSTGLAPTIIPTSTEQDTHTQLINEFKSLASKMVANKPTTSILILHANSKQLLALQRTLARKLPQLHFHNTKSGPAPQQCFAQFSTLNAATGLEASVVFLLGIDSLLHKESSPLLVTDEQDDLITQNTRQLYMAFTRAAQKLIIFSKLLK